MLKLMMQSRINAALFVALFSVALFVLPLVYVLSIATLSLVSLQKGLTEGLIVGAIATVLLFATTLVFGGQAQDLLWLLLVSWLPVIVISTIVKNYGNIDQGLKFGFLLALLVLGFLYVLTAPNSSQFWLKFFEANLAPMLEKLNMPEQLFAQFKTILTVNMNGLLTSSIVLMVVLGLIIGRYWQAKLYNPGGFGTEFKQIRLGKVLAIITLVVLLAASFLKDLMFFTDLQRSFILLFVLQGLAVLHYFLQTKQYATGVLAMVYVVIFLLPVVAVVLAITGILDNWFNFRRVIQSPS